MSDSIASAARRWDAARIEAKRLRKLRASFVCMRDVEHKAKCRDPAFVVPCPVPCWKETDTDEFGRRYRNEDLCGPCSERQGVHEQLAVANRKRGDAQRALILRLAGERKRLGLTEAYEPKTPRRAT